MSYILVPIDRSQDTGKHDVFSNKVFKLVTKYAIFKGSRMSDENIVFESEDKEEAVRELTRLRLSCSSGACED